MAKGADTGRDRELGTSILAVSLPWQTYMLRQFFLRLRRRRRKIHITLTWGTMSFLLPRWYSSCCLRSSEYYYSICPWSWFDSLKANSIFRLFHALLVSYLLTQEMIDQLFVAFVSLKSREKKRHWEVPRKQICREMKRDSFGLPLSWLFFQRWNLEESRVKSRGTSLGLGRI